MWITTKMVIDIPFWVGGELYMDTLMWDWMRNKKEVALHREKIAENSCTKTAHTLHKCRETQDSELRD